VSSPGIALRPPPIRDGIDDEECGDLKGLSYILNLYLLIILLTGQH